MKKIRNLLCATLLLPAMAFAQDDLGGLLKGGAADATYLADGYISPFMKAFGYGLTNGWNNTAKPHKFPGGDITFSIAAVYIPASDKSFEVDNAKLNSIFLLNNNDGSGVQSPSTGKGQIPTLFGKDVDPTFQTKNPATDVPTGTPFSVPGGSVPLNFLPVPVANIGIGLPKGFDLKFRYIPTINIGELSGGDVTGELGLFGVGVLHDFKQYIPGIKALPFDLSAFVGYTRMKLDAGVEPGQPNNKAEFSSSATTIQALISKKIAVITPYASIGYNIAKTSLAVKGSYDLDGDGVREQDERDPVNFEESSSGPRMTAGLRLKLAIFAFHADYTLQKYNTLTVGFGLNVR
jgi:hypothetical protein